MTMLNKVELIQDQAEIENYIFAKLRGRNFFAIVELDPEDGDELDYIRHCILSCGINPAEMEKIMTLMLADLTQGLAH
jgi:hypothetical protein